MYFSPLSCQCCCGQRHFWFRYKHNIVYGCNRSQWRVILDGIFQQKSSQDSYIPLLLYFTFSWLCCCPGVCCYPYRPCRILSVMCTDKCAQTCLLALWGVQRQPESAHKYFACQWCASSSYLAGTVFGLSPGPLVTSRLPVGAGVLNGNIYVSTFWKKRSHKRSTYVSRDWDYHISATTSHWTKYFSYMFTQLLQAENLLVWRLLKNCSAFYKQTPHCMTVRLLIYMSSAKSMHECNLLWHQNVP